MYGVELYAAVRLAVVDEGLSHHEAGRRFGIDRRTVKKMLSYSAPPGYRRTKPVRRPKLDGFTGIVDAILEADTDPEVPRKQRHTAHRIFERLRDEHGFSGGYTIVKDYVRSRRQSVREAFVPLHHPPGHAQVDFGEATVEVGGRREKVAFFCLILPHSNVWFVKAYPRETTEAFLDGHVSALAFLGGVPRSILYDNTTLAVARILGDGTRRRTQAFTHLQSHYLFRDRFGRPGKGNDKGKVEALVKTARRRFMVPIPKVHDLSVLNERLLARCLERLDALEAGGQAAALLADLEALRDLPAVPFEACEHVPGQISSTALVRYRLVDYSAPAAHAHKKVMVKGYVDRVARSAPRSSPAIGAPMSAATSSTTRCTICRCWRRSRAPWTRRRRCGDGSSTRPSARCAASSRRASARAASANTSRCCACTKTSRNRRWRPRCATR